MPFDPTKSFDVVEQEQPKKAFDPNAKFEVLEQVHEPSQFESFGRGALQSGSFGFSDELTAAGESSLGSLGLIKDKTYDQSLQEARGNNRAAEKANPGSYLGGELAAGVATSLIPIPGLALAKGATLTQLAGRAALEGAVQGLGRSDAESKTSLHGIGDALEGAATGAALAGTIGLAGRGIAKGLEMSKPLANTVQSTKNAFAKIFSPGLANDWGELQKVAAKNGINPDTLPEAVKYGPSSLITRMGRSRAEGPLGEVHLKQFEKSLGEVNQAVQNKMQKIGGGIPVASEQAGNIIRQGFDQGVDEFFKKMDFTYNTVMDQVPGMRLTDKSLDVLNSKLNGLEKFAKGRAERGVGQLQRGQAQELLQAVGAIRKSNGSMKQTLEALRDIGETSFKSTNSLAVIPTDVKRMRLLYHDLSEEIVNSTRAQLGDEIADKLVANNKAMTEFFGTKSHIADVIGDKMRGGEQVFDSLVLRGNSKQLEALKSILPPEHFKALKGAFLDKIAKRNPEGIVSFKKMLNTMRDKQTTAAHLFDPNEIEEVGELLNLGDRFGHAILSTSGTGASNILKDVGNTMKSAVVNDYVIEKMKSAAEKKALNRSPLTGPSIVDKVLEKFGAASKYSKVIQEAANRGGQAAASTHYILQQRDPEFRKRMRDEGAQDNDPQ